MGDITSVINAAKDVVQDPCLSEVAELVSRLHDLEPPSTPGVPSAPPQPGIGLCKAVRPLQLVVYVKERPWVLPVAAFTVVGTLIGIGMLLATPSRGGSGT